MLSRRALLGSALGVSILSAGKIESLGAQTPERERSIDPVLSDYLSLSPLSVASLDLALPLTYGNAQLQMETLGFALPFDQADEEAVKNWVSGSYSVMLPSPIRNNALRDEFEELTGFQIGQVFSGAEVGVPPDMATLLRGELQSELIQAVQRTNGYREIDLDGHLVMSLAEDASVDLQNPVQRMALARLNNSTFLDDGTLVYTATLDLMRAMLNPQATLDQQPFVQDALMALDEPLIGGVVAGPGALVPGIPGELLQPGTQAEIADFIEAMHAREQAPVVLTAIAGVTAGLPLLGSEDVAVLPPGTPKSVGKFALVYASAAEAALAAEQIDERLATGTSQVIEEPWSALLADWSAVATPDRNTVLVTMTWNERPRVLDLIYARDIAFITG